MNLKNNLLKVILVLSTFTAWFALSGKLRLPVTLLLLLFALRGLDALNGIFQNFPSYFQKKEDKWLMLFLAAVFFSFLFAEAPSKAMNHLIAMYFVISINFFFLRWCISGLFPDRLSVLKYITFSFLVTAGCVIFEFLMINLTGFDIRPPLIFAGPESLIKIKMYGIERMGLFTSASGPADEPGSTSLFMNVYGPLSLLYAKESGKEKLYKIVLWLYPVSILMLTSTAGVAVMMVLFLMYNFRKLEGLKQILKTIAVGLTIALVVLPIVFPQDASDILKKTQQTFDRLIVAKVLLDSRDPSAKSRSIMWLTAIDDVKEAPWLGKGPGYGSAEYKSGYLSMYLTFLAEIGILGFFCWMMFQIQIFKRIMRLEAETRIWFLMASAGAFIHLNIVGDYYHLHHFLIYISVQLFDPQTENTA